MGENTCHKTSRAGLLVLRIAIEVEGLPSGATLLVSSRALCHPKKKARKLRQQYSNLAVVVAVAVLISSSSSSRSRPARSAGSSNMKPRRSPYIRGGRVKGDGSTKCWTALAGFGLKEGGVTKSSFCCSVRDLLLPSSRCSCLCRASPRGHRTHP